MDKFYKFSEDIEFASKLKALNHAKDYRRSGRTFLLLRIAIEKSIEEGGSIVKIIDHFNRGYEIRSEIYNVLSWYSHQGVELRPIEVNRHEDTYRFDILSSCRENYNRVRIPTFYPEVKIEKEEQEFSKLLLIL